MKRGSAAFGAHVLGIDRRAVLVHMVVFFAESVVFPGVVKAVFAEELAVGQIRVGIDTFLRTREVLCEEIGHVDISWVEFSRVDL